MRKIIAGVLLGLGSFLLVTALLTAFWAPGAVKKTPLDTDSTTYLSGEADKLNPATGEVENSAVKATSVTKADSKRSDDEVIVFVNTSCLVINEGDVPDCVDGDDPRLVTASSDVFATNRKTAQAVNGRYLPAGSEEKEGLINKWPFNVEKKDYDYWDGLLGEAVTATYSGTQEINDLQTYKFHVEVPETSAEIINDVMGTYSTSKDIYVDPLTGSIVNQTQHEVRTLENGDPVLDLQLAFTEDEVADSVQSAKDSGSQINLLTKTVPLISGILGLVFILLGLFLMLRGDRNRSASA